MAKDNKEKKTEELDEHEDERDEEESDDESEEEEESEEDDDESEEDDESDEDDESEESEEDDSDDDEESDDEDEEEDDDFDDDLDRERKGKPDRKKAKDAFKEREAKRKGDGFITEERLEQILENDRKERREADALTFAKQLTKSPKAAELIVEKWKNRTFPKHLTLQEQIVEMFGAVYAKRLLGEKKELMRALKNKGNVNRGGTGSHQDSQKGKSKLKFSGPDAAAIKAAGWSEKNGMLVKKLANGSTLIRDPRTGKTRLEKPTK